MDSREIRELLSACRPDRSDLTAEQLRAVEEMLNQDAALREQCAAGQAWDAQLHAAFADVPIPAGLADRLLAAVSVSNAEQPAGLAPVTRLRDELPAEPVASVARRSRWNRRTVLSVGACAAALLLVAVPLGYWHWSDRLTTEFVVDSARNWTEQIDSTGWRNDAIPAADHPLDPTTVALYNVVWQRMALLSDAEAVVYGGTLAPDHSSAWLFVVRTREREGRTLPSIPPTRPDSSTGGFCIGVWKSQDSLYVLVVRGSQRDYLRALRQAYA